MSGEWEEPARAGPRVVPAYLHGVVGVLVVEDERLLDELVVSLQLVDVGLVVDDVLLVLLQAVHLLLQGAGNVHRHVADLLNGTRIHVGRGSKSTDSNTLIKKKHTTVTYFFHC